MPAYLQIPLVLQAVAVAVSTLPFQGIHITPAGPGIRETVEIAVYDDRGKLSDNVGGFNTTRFVKADTGTYDLNEPVGLTPQELEAFLNTLIYQPVLYHPNRDSDSMIQLWMVDIKDGKLTMTTRMPLIHIKVHHR